VAASRWWGAPRRGCDLAGRYLPFAESEEIALARAAGASLRTIAARLGRSPSTISRELARNADPIGRYLPSSAHVLAYQRASRPKPAKLVTNQVLRERVQTELTKRYSPEQIAARVREDFPKQPEMWVLTHEHQHGLDVRDHRQSPETVDT
jgi:transposase, IS30 family